MRERNLFNPYSDTLNLSVQYNVKLIENTYYFERLNKYARFCLNAFFFDQQASVTSDNKGIWSEYLWSTDLVAKIKGPIDNTILYGCCINTIFILERVIFLDSRIIVLQFLTNG